MSAHSRIDIAAHDAGWTIEHHGFAWLYSAPNADHALAIGTQYTMTGQPRKPLLRIGGTLRPITGADKTGQIIAIIESTCIPTTTDATNAAPN
ncbi:Uncharacterised protein [Mycobacteroides abscessus subsp. abscessus]|uniref:hypothetical protein n=1 Tax=Mycobacteroides abscessus TaxID=36809 RepID=UPI000929CCF7|nr:hypothetical protein [Mycobacteroides abscessus]SIH56374.1 Uncharacterised protein [Mycobacteroides abscessus subsp. abscessus]